MKQPWKDIWKWHWKWPRHWEPPSVVPSVDNIYYLSVCCGNSSVSLLTLWNIYETKIAGRQLLFWDSQLGGKSEYVASLWTIWELRSETFRGIHQVKCSKAIGEPKHRRPPKCKRISKAFLRSSWSYHCYGLKDAYEFHDCIIDMVWRMLTKFMVLSLIGPWTS